MADSLVPAEARALIGQVQDERSGVVDKKEFQRWAGYRDVIRPPLFLSQVTSGVTLLDSLRPDGTLANSGPALPLPPRRMAGGAETFYYLPVYPGDVLTSQRKLADIAEKHGRSGRFVLVTSEVEYRNQDGALVAKSRSSMIAR
jgi:hydroxyacyl-ACP dehydratase HTD2-like protein with hotdog domain